MEKKDRKVERGEAGRESVREKRQQLDALNGNRAILIELLILERAHDTQRLILPRLFIWSRDRFTRLSGSEIFPRDLNIDQRRHMTSLIKVRLCPALQLLNIYRQIHVIHLLQRSLQSLD